MTKSNEPGAVFSMFHRGFKSLSLEQLDERRGKKGSNDGEGVAESKRVDLAADQLKGFLALGDTGADVETVMLGGGHTREGVLRA